MNIYFGHGYFDGILTDDYVYEVDSLLTSKLNTSVWIKELYSSEYNMILHNSPGYLFIISQLASLSIYMDGYHTLIPRLLNSFFFTLMLIYIIKIANKKSRHYYTKFIIIFVMFMPVNIYINAFIFRDTLIALLIVMFYFYSEKIDFRNLIILFFILISLYFLRIEFMILLLFFGIFFHMKKFMKHVFLITIIIICITFILEFNDIINGFLIYTGRLNSGIMGYIYSVDLFPFGFLLRFFYFITFPHPVLSIDPHRILLSLNFIFLFPLYLFVFQKKRFYLNILNYEKSYIYFIVFFIITSIFTGMIRHVIYYLPFFSLIIVDLYERSYYKTKKII